MKKTTPKKLTLSRETLRDLTDLQTKAVQGGVGDYQNAPIPITSDSINACCC
ncbi:MAG TPA: class I lanthipeptide [Thermoanaerobaculia bacterium]|jgi:hypothetical protein